MAENCVEVAKRQSYIPEKKNAAEAILEAFCDVSFVVYGRCVSKKRPRDRKSTRLNSSHT